MEPMVNPLTVPGLSSRPWRVQVERSMRATPQALYTEWTERFDQWFAAPGTLSMIAAVNAPFFFQVEADGELHSHYGRFLKLDPARLIELT